MNTLTSHAIPSVHASANQAPPPRLVALRQAADAAVGSIFVQPVLNAAYNGKLKGTIGHGGRGEEMFRNQLNQVLAEQLGKSTGWNLSEILVDRLGSAAVRTGEPLTGVSP